MATKPTVDTVPMTAAVLPSVATTALQLLAAGVVDVDGAMAIINGTHTEGNGTDKTSVAAK